MDDTFSSNLRELRKNKGLSQEQIADNFGISVQAVSKWECAQSYPDIELLPALSDLFGVTIDALLRGAAAPQTKVELDLPDDNVLRIVQFIGKTILQEDDYDPNVKIPLSVDRIAFTGELRAEIWGSADIQGSIAGNITAGTYVNCGNVGGNVDADETVNCGNVDGNVDAGDSVNCGNVEGDVDAGDGVSCGDIEGNATAGDGIQCGNIKGNVSCEDDLHCQNIQGNVKCDGDIYSAKQ